MSKSIIQRKRSKILNLVKGIAVLLFVLSLIGIVGHSDLTTLQEECQSGLKVCR